MPHFSSDKSQKVFKIQKNSPLPIIAIFLLLIALCGIVSADNVLNASLSDAQGYAFSTISEQSGGDTTFALYFNNAQYLSNLNYVSTTNNKISFSSWNPNNVKSWSSPASLFYGSNLLCNGNFYASFVSNYSPTLSYFNLQYIPSNILTNLTGVSGQIPVTISISNPPSPWPVSAYYLGSYAPPVGTTTAYFTGYSHDPLEATGVGSASAASWNYNFINSISLVNNAGSQSTISINRIFNSTGGLLSSYSEIIINDSINTIYSNSVNTNNQVFSFNPPQSVTIIDLNTGTQWSQVFNYVNINMTAPILNASINTPLTLQLVSSNGIIPSDINAISFTTNFPNSNNILSNILYDNNQTQRNPLTFYKKSGNWYQSDGIGFNINLGSTLSNSFTTTFINANNYYVTATLNSNLIGGFAANNPLRFYITGTNAGTSAYFTISDSKTGNPISGSILGIFDVPNQKWTNTTLTSGSINLPLTTNYFYAYQGTAPNYQPSAFNTLLIPSGGGNATISIALIPSSLAVTAGNTTISIAVVNGLTNAPVSGATVTVSAANATNYTTQSQTTVNGNTLFVVPTGNTYTASASATGYQSGSLIAVVGSSPVTQTISLTPLSSVPTIATSTTTYPGQQPSIYPTLNGTVTDQTNPFFGNAIDWLGFMGAKPSEIALVLAFLLILLGGVCGSAASSVGLGYAYQPDPLGALAGALLGFIASVAFGFFPAWLAVAAVIIIAFIVARRAWA